MFLNSNAPRNQNDELVKVAMQYQSLGKYIGGTHSARRNGKVIGKAASGGKVPAQMCENDY